MHRKLTRVLAVAVVAGLAPIAAEAQQKPPVPAGKTPAAPPAPVAPVVPKPGGDAFVVLDDGTLVLAATVEAGESDITARRPAGSEDHWPREDVSIAVSGGKRIHKGEESGIYKAWKTYLQAAHVDPSAVKKIADADPAVKAAWWADVLAAADACAGWKMKYAASALLADGIEAGTWDDAAQSRAIEWEPTAFPFSSEDAERAKLCASWAREIVPLGGQWILRKDGDSLTSSRSALWTQEAIALGTKNVLLFTLDKDPVVAGASLRQGETTVRALESLFGKPEIPKPDRLEIRLFESRDRYLIESDTAIGKAQVWTAGFFSPGDMVSRFYSRDKAGGKFNQTEFFEVLSHELTHHWIEMRYCAGVEFEGMEDRPSSELKKDLGRNLDQPGHWVIEGTARFVEDQAIHFQKRGLKFDDASAECIRDCAAAWRAGIGIPIARYVDITTKDFQFLGKGPKRGRGDYVNSETGVFYDQGGALSFFMMNKRGADGRKRFVQYLRDVYAGKMSKEGWTRLGFASAAELEKEFTAFLTSGK